MAKSLIKILTQKETVSLLSVTTGQLDIVRVPAIGMPDWVIPKDLLLSIEPFQERIWNYLWRGQDVSVYHLLPKDVTPTSLVIVESVTDVHRLALQIKGEVSFHSVRIADLVDASDAVYQKILQEQYPDLVKTDKTDETSKQYQPQFTQQDYIYQPVLLRGELCVVPDLDKLSHFLVDLDS